MNESKRKETFKKPFLILGLSFIALGCTLGISSLAWFSSPTTTASVSGLNGEATGSYFDGGTGVEGDPYIIANAKQLYYFAWLQDMGYFNEAKSAEDSSAEETIPTTYFKIKNGVSTLDANGYTLPPIGIEKYPFVGNFDANNCTITNLTIANKIDTNYISQYPSLLDTTNSRLTVTEFNNTSQASIVGFFGIIGQYSNTPSVSYDSEANEVKNLYLDNITIKTSDKSNLLIGIFAGYVNGMIDNCGVHYAKMNINGATSNLSNFSKVSRFALIGDYNTEKYSYDQDKDSSDSGDEGYGTSIDVYSLYNKLSASLDSSSNPLSIPNNYAIPIKLDSSASVVTGSGTTTVNSSGANISVSNGSTIKANESATNIGYYSGGLSVYKDTYTSKDFSSITTATNSPITYTSLEDAQKEKIQNYLAKETETGKNSDNAIALTGTSNFNASNQTSAKSFPTSSSAYTVIQDARVGTWTGNLFIPTNGIWIAPIKPGRFEFIASGTISGTWNRPVVLIVRLIRNEAKNYSVGFKNTTYLVNFRDDWSNSMVGFSFPGNQNVYYGINITQDDIDAGYEFFITNDADVNASASGSPEIFYLDIGTDGSSGDDTTTKTVITNFDFVTKDSSGSLMKIKNYNETSKAYEKNEDYAISEVTFKIGNTAAGETVLAFRRLNDTVGVYYYQSAEVLTPSSSGTKTPSSKEDCTSA